MSLRELLEEYGLADDENFKGTPERVERFWRENFTAEPNIQKYFNAKFSCNIKDLLIVKDINVKMLCPHHLLPVDMNVSIGYLPREYVLGLSKFARVAIALTKPPKLQEDYANVLADVIFNGLKPKWVMVVVNGQHGCMRDRGVLQTNANVMNSAIRGLQEPHLKQEFIELIKIKRSE